MGALKFQRNVN